MLVHKRLSELLLVVAEFILIEVELIVGRHIRRPQLLRQHCLRVYPADPRVKQYLL